MSMSPALRSLSLASGAETAVSPWLGSHPVLFYLLHGDTDLGNPGSPLLHLLPGAYNLHLAGQALLTLSSVWGNVKKPCSLIWDHMLIRVLWAFQPVCEQFYTELLSPALGSKLRSLSSCCAPRSCLTGPNTIQQPFTPASPLLPTKSCAAR